MAPSRVDPNQKQAKSSIDKVEEDPFCIDRMAKTVSASSQATVHLAKKTPQDLYYECLGEGEARRFLTPNLLRKINMQIRYAVARATVTQLHSIHVQCQFPRIHFHHMAILMKILMVHLHRPRRQMQLK
jgi:hypothetical protein